MTLRVKLVMFIFATFIFFQFHKEKNHWRDFNVNRFFTEADIGNLDIFI